MRSDIVIVGAGLVGTPLSLALSRRGFSVTLIDRGPLIGGQNSGDENPLLQQCTALSRSSQLWFAANGLWASIADDASAITRVHVSQRGYFGATRMDAQELGLDALGFVVNNRRMLDSLRQQLPQSEVTHLADTEIHRVNVTDSDSVTVHCQCGDDHIDVNARLLIATDGVTSTVRESLGIAQQHTDYSQVGILGSLELHESHGNTAYERFTDTGPLAMLPRGERHMSFVECIDEQDRSLLEAKSDDEYRHHLQSRFGYRLGIIKEVGPRFFTPLLRIEARSQIATRSLLLGNAARLLHPVAGQGYNLAIRDIESLLSLFDEESTHEAALSGDVDFDPGSSALLTTFVSRRKKDQQAVVSLTDALARSFRGSAALPSHVRSLGLMGLDAFTPLRRGFARRSMGLRG